MSWSYSGNPSSSAKDAVRFLVGDTDTCEQLLQDGEITYLLGQYNNSPLNASIRACEAIMVKFARLVDESVGQVKMTYSQRLKSYQLIQTMLRNRLATEDAAPYAGGISQTDQNTVDANADRVRPAFTRNMQKNWQLSPWIQGWEADWFAQGD